MALSACDLLRGRDGSEPVGSREGRFFGGKQLKKESIPLHPGSCLESSNQTNGHCIKMADAEVAG
jgi:hypothetical protein